MSIATRGPRLALTAATLSLAALSTTAAPSARAGDKPLENQALVDAYAACWGAFNKRAWPEFAACYAKDAVTQSSGLPDAKGQAVVEQHSKPFVAGFPDVTGAQQLVLANGKNVASVTLVAGTNSGPLKTPAGELPPTGKKIGVLIAHAVEAGGDAAVKRAWLVVDHAVMFAQLGLSPMPARPAIASGGARPVVVVADGGAGEKKNLAAARAMYAGFNKRDKKVFDVFAEDIVDANPSAPADIKGKDAVVAFMSGFWQMSSDVKVTSSTLFAAGDYVVSIGSFAGRNDGDNPAFGIKKTGKRFKTAVIEITKWQDGKLTQIWPFFDGADLAKQLGLIPPPPAHAAR